MELVGKAHGELMKAGDDARASGDPLERRTADDESAEHQQRYLDDVGERHGFQAAVQRIGQGKQPEREQRRLHGETRDRMHRGRAQPEDGGQVHEDVDTQPEHRHHRAHRGAVAPFQEFRHGVNAVLEEYRQQEFADDEQREAAHPFVRGDADADHIARSGHADDLLGGNVGGDQRGADGPPGQRAAGKEIVLCILLAVILLARDPLRQ